MHAILSAELSRVPPPLFSSQLCLFNDWLPRIQPVEDAPNQPRSALMRELLRILKRVARSGAEVPTNPILAIQTCSRRQSAARAVRALERDGFIRIETRGQRRRIVFPDGRATDWGDFREGHPPGPRRTEPAKAVRAPNSPPLPPSVQRMPAEAIRPAVVCQFQTWDDSERPRNRFEEQICGVAAVRGESWCMEHLAIVSPARAKRRAALLSSTSLCCSAVGGTTP